MNRELSFTAAAPPACSHWITSSRRPPTKLLHRKCRISWRTPDRVCMTGRVPELLAALVQTSVPVTALQESPAEGVVVEKPFSTSSARPDLIIHTSCSDSEETLNQGRGEPFCLDSPSSILYHVLLRRRSLPPVYLQFTSSLPPESLQGRGLRRRHAACGGPVVAAAGGLSGALPQLPAAGSAGLLGPGAAAGGAAAGRHGAAQAGLPQPQLRLRRVPGGVSGQGAVGQQVRRVRAAQRVVGVQLGPELVHVLRQHPGHHRGLWSHHAAVRRREALLHLLRPDRRALHHAGADGVRAEADAAAGLRPGGAPEALGPAASARHRRPLPAAAAAAGALLLHGAGGHLQPAGGVLVLLGRRLLLLHLAVHHRTGGPGAVHRAGAEIPTAVPGVHHGLPVPGSDDDVPAAAHLPQDGRPARPDRLPAAAALRGVRPGRGARAHHGRGADAAAAAAVLGEGCHQAAGAGIAAVLQLHQQGLRDARPSGRPSVAAAAAAAAEPPG